MTYYDVPEINSTRSLYDLFHFITNTTTDGLFFAVMLLVVWVISFMSLKGFGNSRAFTFASFLCAILGIILGVLDLLSQRWMYLAIFMTLVGFVWLKLESTPRF